MKTLKLLILGLLFLACAAALWLWIDMQRFAQQPAGSDSAQFILSVAPGESFNTLSAQLKNNGIITSNLRFKLLARFQNLDTQLKAGEYALAQTMTPMRILDTLVNGKVMLHRLTIPEGFSIEQIAQEISRTQLADGEIFKALAFDPAFASALGVEGSSLEGYLFPDTYYFPKGVSSRAIIEAMVERFNQTFSESWRRRAAELHWSIHQVVTLASIIEKETGDPAERPLIASVFHNRLKKKMRLESDPTVIYGIADFDGNLTRRHLTTATPYNTYMISGLPPGPITNPGQAALQAALYPAQTDYLFFVSKKDGTHYFSDNFKQHNQAVREYQLRHRKH